MQHPDPLHLIMKYLALARSERHIRHYGPIVPAVQDAFMNHLVIVDSYPLFPAGCDPR
jgi:hypothetical protein